MIRFILGRSGFGKTYNMLKLLSEHSKAGERCILLTPEQVSFEYEKLVALRDDIESENVEVLNFTRLTRLCFNKLGGPGQELLSPMASFLLMSLSLEEMKDTLNIYRRNYQSYGFVEKLVQTAKELRLSGIDPSRLAELSYKQPEGYLRDKSYELSLIFDAYYAMMSQGYFDESDALEIAAEKLTPMGSLEKIASTDDGIGDVNKPVTLFFDGFSGFTALQYKLLRPLIAQSKNIIFTLPFDNSDKENHVFTASAQTMSRIKAMARELEHEVGENIELNTPYRFRNADLEAMEVLASGGEATLGSGVRLYPARDGYDELEWVCSEISRMIREEAYRYKDFAIIPRYTNRYDSFLTQTLLRYDIEYYLDERKDTSSQMCVKWLLLGGQLLAKGISTSLMLEILKSPMLSLPHEAVAELENYCYTWRLKGKAWTEELLNHPDGLVEVITREAQCRLIQSEALRHDLTRYLSALLSREGYLSGKEFAELLYEFFTKKAYIRNVKISDKRKGRFKCSSSTRRFSGINKEVVIRRKLVLIISPEENLRSYGDKSDMTQTSRRQFLSEQSMLWEQICHGLDLFATIVDQVHLSKTKLFELLELVVRGFETASAPPTLDQVLIGTADRIRPINPRCVFILGAVEGEYPPPAMLSSLFTQSERRSLCGEEDDIADSLEELNARERLSCYAALTAASERVYISYPRSHSTTKSLESADIYKICSEAGALVETASEDMRVINAKTAVNRLPYLMSADIAKAKSIEDILASMDECKEIVEKVNDYKEKKQALLNNYEVTRKLFGSKMRLSPSRVDKYNSCPFSYFVSGGLKIYPRGKAEITPLSSGSLIHKAIEVVVAKYGGKGISKADRDELRAVIAEIVVDYISKMEGGRQALTPRNYYLFERLADSIYELAVRLGEEFEQSEFEPISFEQSIGSDSDTPPITLSLPDGTEIQVIGSIDRVDVAEIDGKRYIRVVDYKSGGKKFALSDVYYGLNMQMLIYLFSIWKEGKGKYENTLPAGVLYMPAVAKHFTTDRLDTGEQYMKARNNHYKMNGLLLGEDDVLKAMDAEGGIFIPKQMAQSKNSFATLEELGKLAQRVQEQISLMAYRLLKGKIGAKPTISGGRAPCEYCDYKGICGFEDSDPINEKAEITREQLLTLNLLEKEVEDDGEC